VSTTTELLCAIELVMSCGSRVGGYDMKSGDGPLIITDKDFCYFPNAARRVWKDYFPAVDSVVFLIDSCDRARFGEAQVELNSLLTDEQLLNCPVLILGNKIDRAGAASEDELRNVFGLYGQTTGKVHTRISPKLCLCSFVFSRLIVDKELWCPFYL